MNLNLESKQLTHLQRKPERLQRREEIQTSVEIGSITDVSADSQRRAQAHVGEERGPGLRRGKALLGLLRHRLLQQRGTFSLNSTFPAAVEPVGTVGGRQRGGRAPLTQLRTRWSSEWRRENGITPTYQTGAERWGRDRCLPQAAELHVVDNLIVFWERLWLSVAIVWWFSGGRHRRRRGELRRLVFLLVWQLPPRILQRGKSVRTLAFSENHLGCVSPPTDLQGRVALDVLGTFNDGEVGEAKLVCGLDQAHTTTPHLQQHLTDPHWRRVFAAGHLHTAAAVRNFNPSDHTVQTFRRAGNKPVKGRCPPDRRCPSVRSQRCSAPPLVPDRSSDSPTLAPWRGSWGRRRETRAPRSQARWCSGNVKSHVSL